MLGFDWAIEKNPHRHALDDFDVISDRVFGRQQTEPSAAAGLDAFDVPGKYSIRH